MSVGLAPPQASKSPLLWMERKGEEGGRQSEWGLPRSSPSACFSPLTKVLGRATLCGHLLPDGSRACSLTLPCPLTPVCFPGPPASCEQLAQSCCCGLQLMCHSPGAAEIRDESHCRRAALSRGVEDGERGSSSRPPHHHPGAQLHRAQRSPRLPPLGDFFSPQGWSSSIGLCWASALREAPLL